MNESTKRTILEVGEDVQQVRRRLLDVFQTVTNTDAPEWIVGQKLIEQAKAADCLYSQIVTLLSSDESEVGSVDALTNTVVQQSNSRREGQGTTYKIEGNFLVKSGDTWEIRVKRSEFDAVIQAIGSIAGIKDTFMLADVIKTTGVSKSHIYSVYTALKRYGYLRSQSGSKYPVNRTEANNLDAAKIWEHIRTKG